jgi:hypothetical protein
MAKILGPKNSREMLWNDGIGDSFLSSAKIKFEKFASIHSRHSARHLQSPKHNIHQRPKHPSRQSFPSTFPLQFDPKMQTNNSAFQNGKGKIIRGRIQCQTAFDQKIIDIFAHAFGIEGRISGWKICWQPISDNQKAGRRILAEFFWLRQDNCSLGGIPE